MSVCVLGSINLDVVCAVPHLPAPGETVASSGVSRYPGGKGLNQAVAAARWGAATRMLGAVGDDEAGRELRDMLAQTGVDARGVAVLAGAATGHGYIHVSPAGENMIVVAGGANLALEPVDEAACDVFLTQLETPIAVIAACLEAPGKPITILNAAPAVLAGEALFPLFDILIVNETELARYAGAAAAPTALDEVAVLARRLLCRPGQSVVVTLGAAGAAAVTAETAFLVPGRPASAIDTTGAGDCFCGVLAAALDEGQSLAEAMALANAAAALSTETHGAGVSMPTRAATVAFIG